MKRKNIENMLVLEDVYQEKIKTLIKMQKTCQGLEFLSSRMNQMEKSYDERLRYLADLDKRIEELNRLRRNVL